MNKLDYLEKIIAFLTKGQRNKLMRILPNGELKPNLKEATRLVEKTLELNARSAHKLSELKEKHKTLKEKNKEEISVLKTRISHLEKENASLEGRVEALNSDPVSVDNAKIVEDLSFLSTLKAAGVDNWDGYDHACEIHNEYLKIKHAGKPQCA